MKKLYTLAILFLGFLFAQAQTNVGGGIYANTTWTKANSPYIVTSDVTLSSGFVLTIEPGVTVKFVDYAKLFMNQSSIIAVGTQTDSIIFTSNSTNPHPGSWNGIQMYLGSTPSQFSYCTVRYAGYGLWVENAISIRNSIFQYNYYGLNGSAVGGDCLIDSSDFIDNVNYGIYGMGADFNRSLIQNCHILRNDRGINAKGTTIKNCVIDLNNTEGIICGYDSVMQCDIRYNGTGITDEDADAMWTYSGSVILNNRIENNNVGIKIGDYREQITCNKICSNSPYDFYYHVSVGNTTNVSGNYWCNTDSTSMMLKIYDGYDNAGLGRLYFMPFDTTQCYITPSNCSAYFSLTPDTSILHTYFATNLAYGTGTLNFVWSWGDGTTDSIAYPSHTYANAGLYTICLSITDSVGCTNSYCSNYNLQRTTNTMVYVNVVAGVATGISQVNTQHSDFSIYPNPAINSVTITIDENMLGGTATITDITGRKMAAAQLQTLNYKLETSAFANGVYFITMENGRGRATKKLIINH